LPSTIHVHRLPVLAALAAALALVAAACGSSVKTSTPPAAGNRASNGVAIPADPTRIVSLSPTATEMLFAIGAGHQVVAVDKDSDYPPSVPRTNVDPLHVSGEALARYHPDLVVTSGDSANLPHQLAVLKIPAVVDPAADTLNDTYTQIQGLGVDTGHTAAATNLVTSMRTQIADLQAQAHPKAPGMTYYYELDQTFYTVTSQTFVGQLFTMAGVHNIADSAPDAAGGYPQLSSEAIVHDNPDLIFLADTLCCGQSAATVKARPGWSSIRAVQTGQIVGLNDDIASRWGPRVVDLFRQIVQAVNAAPPPPTGG
jgi:iron complex transport system substrate-binding protein